MSKGNPIGYNAKVIDIEMHKDIKKCANSGFKYFGGFRGNTDFMIMPSCLVYDKKANAYYARTENVETRWRINTLKDIAENLERYDLEHNPIIFVRGKYNALAQALGQAKFNYPDKLIIVKHTSAVLILIYRSDDDNFYIHEPILIKDNTKTDLDFDAIVAGCVVQKAGVFADEL